MEYALYSTEFLSATVCTETLVNTTYRASWVEPRTTNVFTMMYIVWVCGTAIDMMASLEEVFNISAKKGLNNHGTETSAVRRVKDFYTKKTVRRVLEYVSIDYVMLNLTIPEWANKILEEGEE